MPFRGFQRYSFSPTSVRQNAPISPGVYGISNANEWIFIGSGEDVRAALLVHLNSPGTELLARKPTGFVFETCAPEACLARQQRLIAELKPVCTPS
jgi:hypothetical protein